MSQDQNDDLDDQTKSKEGLAKKEATHEDSLVVLEDTAFQGWKDNTKSLKNKKNKKDGKLILGRPEASPKNTSHDSNFIAEGNKISLSVKEDLKPNEYTLGGRIQNVVDNSQSVIEGQKNDNEDARDGINDVDDDNITTRAIRACLAAEAVLAALREECNFLPTRTPEDTSKSSHARRGCKCPGNGTTCNAAISLQLQLAACENLSFAATAAFRELVATRLGVTITKSSRPISPKKQQKKLKKSKKSSNEVVNGEFSKIPSHLGSQFRRGSIMPAKRRSTFGGACGSSGNEELPTGPFSCSHPITTCVPQCEPLFQSSSSCNHAPIVEVPLPECYPGMYSL